MSKQRRTRTNGAKSPQKSPELTEGANKIRRVMTVTDALGFLEDQDPAAILMIDTESEEQQSADILAAPGGPVRKQVVRIISQIDTNGQSVVIFQ